MFQIITRTVALRRLREVMRREEERRLSRRMANSLLQAGRAIMFALNTPQFQQRIATRETQKHKRRRRAKSWPPMICPLEKKFDLFQADSRLRVRFALGRGHVKALSETWYHLTKPGITSGARAILVLENVFEELFQRDTKLKKMFNLSAFLNSNCHKVATIRDHAFMFCIWIDDTVRKLRKGARKQEDWAKAGLEVEIYIPGVEKHLKLKEHGLEWQHWEEFGVTFCDVMFKEECVRAFPGGAVAWRVAISTLTDQLRAVFECPQILGRSTPQNEVKIRRQISV